MEGTGAVFATLIVYNLLLIAVGLWARGRNQDVADFYLAGRGLGPWVAAISASASSSSAWTLLGVSGAAYAWGLPALWLFPATVGGFLVNWIWVAPRLQRLAREESAVTLNAFVAPESMGELRRTILRTGALIIVFCFVFYIASQFEAAGKAFESVFGLAKQPSILLGAGIVLAYTLLGGFWAVSVTDSVQGLLMVVAAIVLPAAALNAVGGPGQLIAGLQSVGFSGTADHPAMFTGLTGLFFLLGFLGITINYPGQPHVVNRFMALKDEQSLRQGRIIAIAWAVIVYAGMLTLGLCARVLYTDLGDFEQVLFRSAQSLLPGIVAGIMLAAVLSAIMSTADSQLLVAASAISYDWNLADGKPDSGLRNTRITVVIVLLMATGLALLWRADIFSRVLFAWSAMGAAFGPILLVRLAGRSLPPAVTLVTMLTGFLLTVLISMFLPTPGDVAERVLPFFVSLTIAITLSKSRPQVS